MSSVKFFCILFTIFIFYSYISCYIRIPLEKHSFSYNKNIKNINNNDDDIYNGIAANLFGNLKETHSYYATIYVGNQPFSVLIDTGSVNLAIPDENCHLYENPTDSKAVGICPTANSFYIPSSNSSFIPCESGCSICQDHNCWFSVSYADNNYIRGPLINDIVSLEDLSVKMLFGAIERESPHFSSGSYDGILGFAFADLDNGNGDSFFDNLVINGIIERNIFSLCFGDNAGEIFLGGYDPDLDAGPIYYTDLVLPYDFYRVQISDITIGKYSLGLDESSYQTTIVDSGTSLIQLQEDIWNDFILTFQSNFAKLPHIDSTANIFTGYCFTDFNLELYPSIIFNLDGIEIEIPSYQYMIPSLSITGEECLSLGIGPSSNSKTILGVTFMKGYNIIFDRELFQIGFAYLQNCASVAFISGISEGNGISVNAGELFELKVEVQYLISHAPVVGIIVEFIVSKGSSQSMINGVATDEKGIATLETYLISNGTSIIKALVPGSLSPVLEFTIHVQGEVSASFNEYTPFYSPWKQENTNFILGIPTWVILTIFGVFLLGALLLTGFIATLAVRHCRDHRFGTKKKFGLRGRIESNSSFTLDSDNEEDDELLLLDDSDNEFITDLLLIDDEQIE